MTDTLTDIHVLIEAPYKIIQYSTDMVVRDWNSIGQKHKKENNTLVDVLYNISINISKCQWSTSEVSVKCWCIADYIGLYTYSISHCIDQASVVTWVASWSSIYRILHGKCVRTVFTHELCRIRNRTSERSEWVRFLIQNNEYVNTVQSTFHVVLCLLYTYWDFKRILRKKIVMKNKFISNRVIKLMIERFSSLVTKSRPWPVIGRTIFFTSDKNRPTRDEIYFIDFWHENLSMYGIKSIYLRFPGSLKPSSSICCILFSSEEKYLPMSWFVAFSEVRTLGKVLM